MNFDDSLASQLEAVAVFRGLPNRERAERWAERLRMNRAEVERFAEAPAVAEQPFLAPKRHPLVFPDAAAETTRRAVDPRAHLDEQLDRIRKGTALNAFITVDEAGARAQADAVAAGTRGGRLAGMTVAVKDLVAVKGLPRTGGTRAFDPAVPADDAPVVARLRAEGAVIVGTTNLHELAYGITSANPHFGAVGNPRGAGRSPGGSSGGSAAAVAAGMADLAIGTDTAGSIRIPAACCGMVGFKPSYDAVSRDGVLDLAWSLDHVGPMAASVADAALMFEVMAGLEPGRVTGAVAALSAQRFRLVRPANFFTDIVTPEVARIFGAALERLGSAGFTIDERAVADIDLAPSAQFFTIASEATQGHENLGLRRPEGLGEDVRVRLEIGRFLTATDYVKAQRLRRHIANHLLKALNGADALVMPTLLATAPPADAATVDAGGVSLPVHTALTRCTAPFNLAGMPALTLPCGDDGDGLPVGLQIVGRPGEDVAVLGIAAAVEAVLAGG
jgi:aspartyl-tRNA(Asn)/glutamyl-tRNA(Gln) amidotransferase subunit A